MSCQRIPGISPGASAGGGHQWLSGERQAPKLAELAVCRLCLEGWGKSCWILLLLPFSGGLSPQPCEMLLAVTWRLSGDRRWLDKPAFLQLRCRGEIINLRGRQHQGLGCRGWGEAKAEGYMHVFWEGKGRSLQNRWSRDLQSLRVEAVYGRGSF